MSHLHIIVIYLTLGLVILAVIIGACVFGKSWRYTKLTMGGPTATDPGVPLCTTAECCKKIRLYGVLPQDAAKAKAALMDWAEKVKSGIAQRNNELETVSDIFTSDINLISDINLCFTSPLTPSSKIKFDRDVAVAVQILDQVPTLTKTDMYNGVDGGYYTNTPYPSNYRITTVDGGLRFNVFPNLSTSVALVPYSDADVVQIDDDDRVMCVIGDTIHALGIIPGGGIGWISLYDMIKNRAIYFNRICMWSWCRPADAGKTQTSGLYCIYAYNGIHTIAVLNNIDGKPVLSVTDYRPKPGIFSPTGKFSGKFEDGRPEDASKMFTFEIVSENGSRVVVDDDM